MDPIDTEKYILNESVKVSKQKSIRKSQSKLYVPNIPLLWLQKVFAIPNGGAVLKMALVVWRTYKMNGSQDTFQLTTKYLEPFGISRFQRFRGLKGLKEAGLIEVDQKSGRAPIITLFNIKK